MSGLSPASVLFSSDGYELAVVNGSAIPAGNRGLLIEGSDGTNSRFITVDASGRVTMVGAGVAGTPAGGVVSVQGVAGGTAMPVSGTVTANIGTTNGLALDATLAKLTITQSTALGSNTQALVGGSVTTAAPTYTTGNINPLSLTTAGALRIDGSGTTQPVSGTVTANIGTTNGLALDTSVNGILVSQGSTTSGEKGPLIQGAVTTAAPAYTTAQTSPLSLTTTGLLRVDGSGVTQPVSGTVTANAGTGNFTVVQATAANLNATVIGTTAAGSGASAGLVTIQGNASGTPVPVSGTVTATNASVGSDGAAALASDTQVGGKVTTAAPTYTTGNLNALSLTTLGGLRIDGVYASGTANATAADLSAVGGYVTTAPPTYTTGQLNALSLDTAGNLRTTATTNKSGTGTVTSVASAGTNTTILASNAARLGATIYNNTTKNMYVKLAATASTSSFTTVLMKGAYWEVISDYTGIIDAVWDAGVAGSVLVTELTN